MIVPSAPTRSPRSSARSRSNASSPSTLSAAEQLDAARAVDEVGEDRLALPALGGEAAGDAHALVGLAAGLEVVVALARLRDRDDARELVRERVDAGGAQLLELAPPGGEDLGLAAAATARLVAHATSILVIFSSRFLPLGSCTLTVSPFLRPSRPLPTGDSLESRFSDGLASVEPTIVYFSDLPEPSSLT